MISTTYAIQAVSKDFKKKKKRTIHFIAFFLFTKRDEGILTEFILTFLCANAMVPCQLKRKHLDLVPKGRTPLVPRGRETKTSKSSFLARKGSMGAWSLGTKLGTP